MPCNNNNNNNNFMILCNFKLHNVITKQTFIQFL